MKTLENIVEVLALSHAPILRLCLLLVVLSGAIGCRSTTPQRPATAPNPGASAREAWLEVFARGYFPGRSGQVFVVAREGEFIVDRNPLYAFMHGSPWDYDTHIPLLLYGPPFIKTGSLERARLAAGRRADARRAPRHGAAGDGYRTGRSARRWRRRRRGRASSRCFVLDGTRADYFDTYARRDADAVAAAARGRWFANAHVTSVPTLTAVGHANLGTGAEPRTHGLAVNNLFNRVTGKSQEAYDELDPARADGADAGRRLEHRDRRTRRSSSARAAPSARPPAWSGTAPASSTAGRSSPPATAPATPAGRPTRSATALPEALKAFTARRYWKRGRRHVDGPRHRRRVQVPPFRPCFQRSKATRSPPCSRREPIGADDITDLVMVNMKGPDYVGHAYGPASPEIKEGPGRARSPDHARAPDHRSARPAPAGSRWRSPPITACPASRGPAAGITSTTSPRGSTRASPGGGIVVQYFNDAANNEIYLDTARLRCLGSLKDVAAFLETQGFFAAAFTEDEVRAAQDRLTHSAAEARRVIAFVRPIHGTQPYCDGWGSTAFRAKYAGTHAIASPDGFGCFVSSVCEPVRYGSAANRATASAFVGSARRDCAECRRQYRGRIAAGWFRSLA